MRFFPITITIGRSRSDDLAAIVALTTKVTLMANALDTGLTELTEAVSALTSTVESTLTALSLGASPAQLATLQTATQGVKAAVTALQGAAAIVTEPTATAG